MKGLAFRCGCMCGGGANSRRNRFPFEGVAFSTPQKSAFERIQLTRHVVVLVKVGIVKHLGKDFFGEDVLDQHFAHIGFGQRRVDGLLRVAQEFFCGLAKAGVGIVRGINHLAQCQQHGGRSVLAPQRPESQSLGAFKAEEQFEQLFECLRVGHVTAQHFGAVLPQHGHRVVAEDDVILRVAFFSCDFAVQRRRLASQ